MREAFVRQPLSVTGLLFCKKNICSNTREEFVIMTETLRSLKIDGLARDFPELIGQLIVGA